MFKRIWDIDVDAKGNIYVLDDKVIKKFGPRGEFVREIGSEGQGPGEYNLPLKLFVGADDTLYVNDQGRSIIALGTPELEVRSFKLTLPIPAFPLALRSFVIDSQGSAYYFIREYSDLGSQNKLIKTGKTGCLSRVIATFPETNIYIKASRRGGVLGGIQHPYFQECLLCIVAGQFICYAINSEYRIVLVDFEGNLCGVFGKLEKPHSISQKERKVIGDGPDFIYPAHRPFIRSIIADELGRIYVFRRKSVLDKNMTEVVDVFGINGVYLYRFQLPCLPAVIKNGYIYSISDSEVGRERIKRYKIANYIELKLR
jgi:hypothetical protein